MRCDTSLAKLRRLDQDRLRVVIDAFRLIDESRRLTREVPRLMHEPPRLNSESQRPIDQALPLSDKEKRRVREVLNLMHEAQKLDLDAKTAWVRAAASTVARETPLWRRFSSGLPNGSYASCRMLASAWIRK